MSWVRKIAPSSLRTPDKNITVGDFSSQKQLSGRVVKPENPVFFWPNDCSVIYK